MNPSAAGRVQTLYQDDEAAQVCVHLQPASPLEHQVTHETVARSSHVPPTVTATERYNTGIYTHLNINQ